MDLDEELSRLMCQAQEGDGPAYEALLLRVAALVRSFARTRVAAPDWVEEVVQETLLSIHRDRHTWEPSRPLLPWLYAIARHRLLDFAAKQRRRSRSEGPVDPALREPATDPRPVLEPVRSLRRALELLSLRQREVIQMLKLDGLSVVEISRKTGLSESAVKVTAHRGYEQLRKLMANPYEN